MQPEQRKRVLVVDDRREMADMLADELERCGYAVVALDSGREAIERLHREIFDAVITDLRMPQVNGMRVLHESRELDPSRPVIVMTGFGAVDSALDADREGAFHYIIKPFALDSLLGLLKRALDSQVRTSPNSEPPSR